MFRRLLPLSVLSAAVAAAQLPGPQPPITSSAAPAPAIESTPSPQPLFLTPLQRSQIIEGIAHRLRDSYVLPDMAQQLADSLRAHQQRGDYDSINDGAILAVRLTGDLQAVSRDRHLRVEFSSATLPSEQDRPSSEEEEQYRKELDRTNCGFQRAEILPGNIGFVQLNFFGESDKCAATAATVMKFVSHTDAIIFDMRMNHGGDPGMVALLASYLFDRPTHLDDLYNRREDKTTQYWATPEKVSDRMPRQPVYVLTSRLSYSGAEQFCYDLRNLGRATLIGEKTGGAAHPTRNHRIDDHFFIAMPEWRYINSVTRTDWEGDGISPDVPAAPWNALQVAEKLALAKLRRSAAERDLNVTAMR